ncbi:DUF177 domain-containing protein [Candidatus Bipolaricaulota bacterium]|nr:DUF177 domain-containing protein [Candidatus Bipolaricaulota bacterium]
MSRGGSAELLFDVSSLIESPEVPQQFALELAAEAASDPEGNLRFVTPLCVFGEAVVRLGSVFIRAEIRGRISIPCRRCLEPMEREIETNLEMDVKIGDQEQVVDLFPDVMATAIAGISPNVLCREDCRGLCPACGVNLNDDPDHRCERAEDHPRRLGDLLQ